jgi:hypothetical protein
MRLPLRSRWTATWGEAQAPCPGGAPVSRAARQESRGREMAKECVVSVVSLLRGFFGFGGLLSHPLRVLVIDGRPEGGEGTAA